MNGDPNQESCRQGARGSNPLPECSLASGEDGNRRFCGGRWLQRDIHGGGSDLICRFESGEYLLATLATGEMSF